MAEMTPLQKERDSPQRRQERKDLKIFKRNVKDVVKNAERCQIFSLNPYFLSALCALAVPFFILVPKLRFGSTLLEKLCFDYPANSPFGYAQGKVLLCNSVPKRSLGTSKLLKFRRK